VLTSFWPRIFIILHPIMVYAASQFVRRLRHVAFVDYYILKTHIFTWNNKHILVILLILLLFSSTAIPRYCGYTVWITFEVMLHVFILIRQKEYINIYIFVIAFIRTTGWISFPCAVQHHQNRLRLQNTWFTITYPINTTIYYAQP